MNKNYVQFKVILNKKEVKRFQISDFNRQSEMRYWFFCFGNEKSSYFCGGEMAEWSNAAVLKTVDRLRGPGVRIPLSPQTELAWPAFLINETQIFQTK